MHLRALYIIFLQKRFTTTHVPVVSKTKLQDITTPSNDERNVTNIEEPPIIPEYTKKQSRLYQILTSPDISEEQKNREIEEFKIGKLSNTTVSSFRVFDDEWYNSTESAKNDWLNAEWIK